MSDLGTIAPGGGRFNRASQPLLGRGTLHRDGPAGSRFAPFLTPPVGLWQSGRSQEYLLAKIRVQSRDCRYRVTLVGRLGAVDLRRLERACGRALEEARPPLTIELRRVTAIDTAARSFLDRLAARGVVVLS